MSSNPRHPSTILAAMLFVIDDGITNEPDNWRFQRLRDLANEYERALLNQQLTRSLKEKKNETNLRAVPEVF